MVIRSNIARDSSRNTTAIPRLNHADEFKPLDGRTGYDILLTACDPKLVTMQLDLFWAVKGGQDPLAYFTSLGMAPTGYTELSNVTAISRDGSALVGMGLHPFTDPAITDDFEQVRVHEDVREPHTYAVDWSPGRVVFSIDGM